MTGSANLARPARPGTCPGATKCKKSLVVLVLPSSVRLSERRPCPLQRGVGVVSVASRTPRLMRHPTPSATAHHACASKRHGERGARHGSSAAVILDVCPGEMEMGLGAGKNTFAGRMRPWMSECHWIRGPGPRLDGCVC